MFFYIFYECFHKTRNFHLILLDNSNCNNIKKIVKVLARLSILMIFVILLFFIGWEKFGDSFYSPMFLPTIVCTSIFVMFLFELFYLKSNRKELVKIYLWVLLGVILIYLGIVIDGINYQTSHHE